MDIIEQANEVVARLGVSRIKRAHVCGCFSCKAAARDFIGWLATNPEEAVEATDEVDLALASEN